MTQFVSNSFYKLAGVFFLLFLSSSCSTIEFVQNGKEKVLISSASGSEKIIEIYKETPFYFWGLMPDKSTIDFDYIFFDYGINKPSMIKLERVSSFKSTFFTIMTFGFYMPEDYKVTVYSKKAEK